MSSAAVVHKQNKYINIFNKLGAIDREHAISLEEAGIRGSFLFERMCARGIFLKSSEGRYFIDNQAAVLFKENRRKRAYTFLVILLVILAVYILLGGR